MAAKRFYEEYWEHRIDDNKLYDDNLMPRHRVAADAMIKADPDCILDLGCGEGTLGKLLQERDVDAELVGVDVSETALEIAADHYDRVFEWNLNEQSVTDDEFDVEPDGVVCMEVLEHIWEPTSTLRDLRTLMDSGTLVASVPNAVHWEYRRDYLLGRLPQDYTLYGGAEHIQDFTLETFKEAVSGAGFTIDHVNPQATLPIIGDLEVIQRMFTTQFTIIAH